MPVSLMQTMGWTLIDFLWQGIVLAALLYAANAFFESARARYSLAVGTLVLMLLAPVLTFFLLKETPAVSSELATVASVLQQAQELAHPAAGQVSGATTPASIDFLAGFVWLWCCGVLLFSVRAVGGWLVLKRVQHARRESISADLLARCLALQNRLGLMQRIRYAKSKLVDTPAVMGWFRPLILIPASALTGLSREQLEAVIVHELAHIKRLDCFVNLFQIAVETLLFYHPAVWWVNRVIRVEREHCCDDIAVAVCGNAGEYARALTLLADSRAVTPAWALAANGGNLRSRIGRLLGLQMAGTGVPAPGLAVIGVLCAACVLAAASAFHESPPQKDTAPSASATATPGPVTPAAPAPARRFKRVPRIAPIIAEPPNPPTPPTPPADEASSGSYIEDLQALGLKNLTFNELIALKIQGVTPGYIRQIRAAGFNPDVHELIAMRVQGIDPEYVRDLRATGLNPSLHDLVAMKVQGITPEYVRSLQAAGLGELQTHDFIAAKVQGITPEFVKEVRSKGFKDLTLHQLIALKISGVF